MKLTKKIISGMLSVSLSVTLLAGIPFNITNNSIKAKAESTVQLDTGYEEAIGINVQYHTQEEIRNYAKSSNVSIDDALEFSEKPVTESPYSLGKLSDKTLQSALKMLNQVRYIAGISDNVELSEDYNTLCQAGALANYANDELSHYPEKPYGMPDDMYALAKKGASSSNIAWASWNNCSLNSTIITSWMEDGDSSNIDRVGHRRWLINPYMRKTGFGAVSGKNGTYSSVYSFDKSNNSATEYGVAWPAQNMPVEYFGKVFPWSISMGNNIDKSTIKVTLTRKSDGKTWNFSNSHSDGAFYVDNSAYGQKGCIIFRPNNITSYNAGDVFKVEIAGLDSDVSYTVSFFNLDPISDEVKPKVTPSPAPLVTPTQKPTASPSPSVVPTQKPTASSSPSVTPEPVNKLSGINVQYHTQEEIKNYAKNSNVSIDDALEFSEKPVTESPYSLGKLSDKTLQSALKMLNQVRYIAGISDNVELSEDYNTLCQAGALANYANDELSHYPEKPYGMSDDMYTLASEGASSSNIGWASWSNRSLNSTIVLGWMEDGDSSNIDRVGHRRWLINPYMGKTGFGAVSGKNGTYSSVYSFDRSNSFATEYGVAWPAQNMPVEYFGRNFPWSISMGSNVDKSAIKITLTRKNDGKIWSFSNSHSDGAFYVDNSAYGQKGCIIFRPNNITSYNAGDIFNVEIIGLDSDISYTVNFFNLNSSSDVVRPEVTPLPSSPYIPVIQTTPRPTQAPTQTPRPTITPIPTPMQTQTPFPTVTPTQTPRPTITPKPTQTPSPTFRPIWTPTATSSPTVTTAPIVEETTPVFTASPVQTPASVVPEKTNNIETGSKITDKNSKAIYKVTGTGTDKTVKYIKSTKQKPANVTIPDSIQINDSVYKVVSIDKGAFKNNKKLKSVKIGENIASIGTKAFSGCKKLRNITVKTNKLAATNIGKNAFSKGYSKPQVKANKSKCKLYKKIFISKGMSKKCKFKAL